MVAFITATRTRTRAQQRSIDLCVAVHLELSVSWLDFPESIAVFPASHQRTMLLLFFSRAQMVKEYIGCCEIFQPGAEVGKTFGIQDPLNIQLLFSCGDPLDLKQAQKPFLVQAQKYVKHRLHTAVFMLSHASEFRLEVMFLKPGTH